MASWHNRRYPRLRCPKCSSASLRNRTTKDPPVRCDKCGHLFMQTSAFNPMLSAKNFAVFWELCEREWAEQFKRIYHYGESCECGSSTCDECNPGWDQETLMDDEYEEDCPY